MAAKPIGSARHARQGVRVGRGKLVQRKAGRHLRNRPAFQGRSRGRAAGHCGSPRSICLLEFIRDLPRTEANIAACLVDQVGKPAPLAQVQAAVKQIATMPSSFAARRKDGNSRRPRRRTGIPSAVAISNRSPGNATRSPARSCGRSSAKRQLKTYRYKDFRTFRVGISVEGTQLGDEGDLPLTLCVADDADDLQKKLAEVRDESRQRVARERPVLGLRPHARDRRSRGPGSTPPARWSRSTISFVPRTRSPPTRPPVFRTKRTRS